MTLFFAVGNPVFSMKLLFRSCSESEVEVADLTHGYRLLKKSLGIHFKNGKIFPWYVVPNPLLIRPKKVCDPANWHLGHLETAVEKIQGHIPGRCPALWHCTFVLFISLLRSCHGSCPLSPVCYSDLPSSGGVIFVYLTKTDKVDDCQKAALSGTTPKKVCLPGCKITQIVCIASALCGQ